MADFRLELLDVTASTRIISEDDASRLCPRCDFPFPSSTSTSPLFSSTPPEEVVEVSGWCPPPLEEFK